MGLKVIRAAFAVAFFVGTFTLPAAAFSFSSSDGEGTSWNGWKVGDDVADSNGNLTSYNGSKVYVSGRNAYDGRPDVTCGRISNNTTSRNFVWVNAWNCNTNGTLGDVDGLMWRVCKDRFGPDPCGGWSGTDTGGF